MDHESFCEPEQPADGMGIEQRTGCFQKLWSNHLLRIRESVERSGPPISL